MESCCQTISTPQPKSVLPRIDIGAIARSVATKSVSADIPGQLLFLSGQYLLVTRENEAITYKFLSPTAVTAAFSQEPIDSDWLSSNTVRWGHSRKGEWTVQFYPPAHYHLLLANFEPLEIASPMPAFVFLGCGTDYWVWAVTGKQFDPGCQLYHAPLPNVMASGAICFGNNSPPLSSNQGIVQAWDLFWSSPFNQDAVGSKSKSHPQNVLSLLCSLHSRKLKRYPTNDLVGFSNQSVDTVIKQITQ